MLMFDKRPAFLAGLFFWVRAAFAQRRAVNCVDRSQAQAYARFKGARLPSEAEFEYAATSGGRNQW